MRARTDVAGVVRESFPNHKTELSKIDIIGSLLAIYCNQPTNSHGLASIATRRSSTQTPCLSKRKAFFRRARQDSTPIWSKQGTSLSAERTKSRMASRLAILLHPNLAVLLLQKINNLTVGAYRCTVYNNCTYGVKFRTKAGS